MKSYLLLFIGLNISLFSFCSEPEIITLSQDMFLAQRMGQDYSDFQSEIEHYDFNQLKEELKNDTLKKAFWLNMYNVYVQIGLEAYDSLYLNKRRKFFNKEFIAIAGKSFSLNDIEHGILRKSQKLWGLGRLRKWFPGKTEKALRVAELDYRIHFGLNCGAKSCPPIAYYEPENLEEQLDQAGKIFVISTSEYDNARNLVFVSKIFSWYRCDFGGKKGIRKILKEYGAIPKSASKVKIEFQDYDWSVETENYAK